jgi:hypothetical protein
MRPPPAAAAAATAACCQLAVLQSHLCAVNWFWAVLIVCAEAVEGTVSSDLGVLQQQQQQQIQTKSRRVVLKHNFVKKHNSAHLQLQCPDQHHSALA